MQYQCGSCGFFKTTNQLEIHLKEKHNILIRMSRHQYDYHRSVYYIIPKNETKNHSHSCNLDFFDRRTLLRHIDTIHHIHVAYTRGIIEKYVFLDGI